MASLSFLLLAAALVGTPFIFVSFLASLRGIPSLQFWALPLGVALPWLVVTFIVLVIGVFLPMTPRYQAWGMLPLFPIFGGVAMTGGAMAVALLWKNAWEPSALLTRGAVVSGIPAALMLASVVFMLWNEIRR